MVWHEKELILAKLVGVELCKYCQKNHTVDMDIRRTNCEECYNLYVNNCMSLVAAHRRRVYRTYPRCSDSLWPA